MFEVDSSCSILALGLLFGKVAEQHCRPGTTMIELVPAAKVRVHSA